MARELFSPRMAQVGLGMLLFALLGTAPSTVDAFSGGVRGIDLATVLKLYDQTRAMAHADKADKGSGQKLKAIRTIVIDPGHGGENSGATGVAGIREKYLTLSLAYTLRSKLQERYPDARVVLTRYGDRHLTLPQRVHLANLADADLFLSLHYNAAVHNRAVGFETYFLLPAEVTPGEEEVRGQPIATASGTMTGIERSLDLLEPVGLHDDVMVTIEQDLLRARLHGESGLLAESVQLQLGRHLDSTDRGVKQAGFGVLRGALMPAVVVEVGFLTHPVEGVAVTRQAHRERVASALVKAIEGFDQTMSKQK